MGGLDGHRAIGWLISKGGYFLVQLAHASLIVSDGEFSQEAPVSSNPNTNVMFVVGPVNPYANHRFPPGCGDPTSEDRIFS
jgi:hypothetical protein